MSYLEMQQFVGEIPHLTHDMLSCYRKEMDLSQSELGELTGMSRFTISKMERGLYPISRRLDLAVFFLLDVQRKISINRMKMEMNAHLEEVKPNEERPPAMTGRPVKKGKKKQKRR